MQVPTSHTFDTGLTNEEILEAESSAVQDLIQQKLKEGHDSLNLPPLPPGWRWQVDVAMHEMLVSNETLFHVTYTPRRDDGYEEEISQGDLEKRQLGPGDDCGLPH